MSRSVGSVVDNIQGRYYIFAAAWNQIGDYLRFKFVVRSLKVVNDCAERSVKEVTEYINYARDGNQRRHVVMVVQHHRQFVDFMNLTMEQIDSMDDFIRVLIYHTWSYDFTMFMGV